MADPVRLVVGTALVGASALAGWYAWQDLNGVYPGLTAMTDADTPWKQRVLNATIKAESGRRYDAINANADNAGISVGLIQWSQGGGGLTEIVQAWYDADPQRFLRYFGPSSAALLSQVASSSRTTRMQPVDGRHLWVDPWLSRFRAALQDPVFQRVQDKTLTSGQYMRGALSAAHILGGTPTERGLALLFDISVNQGTGAVTSQARAAVKALPAGTFAQRLDWIAKTTPERFRGKRAGSFDLYKVVAGRTQHIMATSALSDAPVSLTV